MDVVVEKNLVVELKRVDELNSVHVAQVLSYMKLSGIEEGLLINFNVKLLKNGLKRFALSR
jgi:GxxExxY protein